MTDKTTKKSRAGLIARLGLAGILATGLGCQTTPTEDAQMFGLIGALMQTSPNSTPQDRSLGAGLSTLGQMQHEMNVAEQGRSQVNVNVYGQEGQGQQPYIFEEGLKKVKVYTTRVDENGKIIEVRNVFYRGERFACEADFSDANVPLKEIDNYLICLDNNKRWPTCHKGKLVKTIKYGMFKPNAREIQEGNHFKVVWIYDGKEFATDYFTILDGPKPKELK